MRLNVDWIVTESLIYGTLNATILFLYAHCFVSIPVFFGYYKYSLFVVFVSLADALFSEVSEATGTHMLKDIIRLHVILFQDSVLYI